MELRIGGKKEKNLNSEGLGESLLNFWNRRYKLFFVFFLMLTLGASGFVWYRSLYESAWSEQERETYSASKDKGINFKEKEFSNALDAVEKRRVLYGQERSDLRDIFKSY